jgi:hypothetical protein
MSQSMARHAVEAVEVFHGLLQEMLDKARASKQTDAIEPPLARADLIQLLQRVESIEHFSTPLEANKSFRYAVIETAIRSVFNDLLVSDSPEPGGRSNLMIPRPPRILTRQSS